MEVVGKETVKKEGKESISFTTAITTVKRVMASYCHTISVPRLNDPIRIQ
jgi:hypothetical protein